MKTIALDFDMAVKTGMTLVKSSEGDSANDAGKMILLGLYTGLRKSDLLKLSPKNFYELDCEYFVKGAAQKTEKEFEFPIPQYIYNLIVDGATLPDTIYSKQRSHIFLNRWMDKVFDYEKNRALTSSGRTISVHSLRKSFGLRVYNQRGINVARQALQHQDTATTSRYLEIESQQLKEDIKSIW